jgi:hypothetical protein
MKKSKADMPASESQIRQARRTEIKKDKKMMKKISKTRKKLAKAKKKK